MFNMKRWLLKFKADSLSSSLKVINCITIFNGLLLFRLQKNGKNVEFHRVSMVTSVLHYIFFITCTILTCEEDKRFRELFFQSEVSSFVAFTYWTLTLSTFTLIFSLSLVLRRNLLKIMQVLVKIDEIFRNLAIKPNYQQITNLNIYMVAVLLVFKVFYSAVNFLLFKAAAPSFPLQVVFSLPFVFMWIYTFIYVTFVYIVKFCMEQINKVSQEFLFK